MVKAPIALETTEISIGYGGGSVGQGTLKRKSKYILSSGQPTIETHHFSDRTAKDVAGCGRDTGSRQASVTEVVQSLLLDPRSNDHRLGGCHPAEPAEPPRVIDRHLDVLLETHRIRERCELLSPAIGAIPRGSVFR